MYKKVSSDMNFVDREKETVKFWKENEIFEKSIEERKDDPTYTFYDGPPTANGKPHIGHVLTRVIKDMIPRYQTMKGHKIIRKAGWDTHGLPVELEVEKMLGLDGKEQIEEYGMEPFIKKCKESVWKYKGMWEDFSDTVGFWADMENPYITYDNNFIESVWWALKQIWDKGLLYKDEVYDDAIRTGDRMRGYIKNIRPDNKIDVSLQIQGYQNIEPNAEKILNELRASRGFLRLNDNSHPEDIKTVLKMSKKTFKKAIGALYRDKVIEIKEDGIYLIQE